MLNQEEFPLLVYADDLVNKLSELLPSAVREHDENAVHQARVATRRLKAAADVFERVSTKSHRVEFVKALRKMRQHLGPKRDLDVMLNHLDELKIERFTPAVDWMRNQLLQRQLALRTEEAEKFDVPKSLARLGAWWGVRQDWRDAGDGLHSLISESLHLQLDRFAEHADAVSGKRSAPAGAVAVAVAVAGAGADMLDPHELRIAGKALRYTLELAVAGGHKMPVGVGRAFKRMQDALGIWHDYVVLTECALKLMVEQELGLHDSKVAAVVLDLAKLGISRATQQLARFNKLWAARGEMLATAVRQAFPLTHPVPDDVIEPKKDPDPTGSEKTPEDSPAVVPGEPSAV